MSARRTSRLRREFLYRKSLESKDAAVATRKRQFPAGAAAAGSGEAAAAEDSRIDDEYASVGIKEPKICVTTSRDPSSRLKEFAKEVRLIFPTAQRMNRGNTTVDELMELCRAHDFSDVVIIQEHRGEPVNMIITHLPYGPTARFALSNCVMRHDIEDRGTVSEAYPHLVFHGLTTPLGARVKTILQSLFPAPKADSKRVITFANADDFISFRHHTYAKAGPKDVQLTEVGPRFEMRLYQISLGTADQRAAETEWVLRPYMNTAKKRKAL